MSALTDAIAQATHSSVPVPAPAVRVAVITDVRRRGISLTAATLTLYADFGSGGVQVAALQSVLDQIQSLETTRVGTGVAYAVGRMAVTVTPSGNGMPIVIGYVGTVNTTL